MEESIIDTEFGKLYTASSRPKDRFKSNPAILLLHGNSISSRVFEPFLEQSPELTQQHQVIVFDFPGHGRSSDAPDPDRSYYQYAYAEAALVVLTHYNIKEVIIFGWSLGGHVALELVSVLSSSTDPNGMEILGIMISGTPPVPKQQILGFKKDGADISALFKPDATKEDLSKVAGVVVNTNPPPQWMIDDILRTNRLAGRTMAVKFMEGLCNDQIKIIHDFSGEWIAVVNGGQDPMLDLDYCDGVCKDAAKLWRGQCMRLEGQGHGALFDEPRKFAALFHDFVRDCCP